ncbi:MAG: glycosyltransferase [Clostridia bacterium]|nr:glycosyltransferase [Clostridia bacterium]
MYKICMLTSSLGIGGAETHILALAKGLTQKGHSVTVVSAGGSLAQHTEPHASLRFVFLPLNDKKKCLFCTRALRQLWKKEKFDIIHAHARYPALLARLSGGSPLVVTAHFPFSVSFPRRLLSVWGKGTLAVSQDIADYLVKEYNLSRENIFITRNGIDTEVFCPLPTEKEGFSIYHAGRFDKDRSLAAFTLLEMMKGEMGRKVTLHLIGDGEDFSQIKTIAEQINRQDEEERVFLYGAQSHLSPFLQRADCFVGVSRAALEAMACGVPVILAGNEGFSSLFTPDKAKEAEKSNFCCREGIPLSLPLLEEAVKEVLSMSSAERKTMGAYNRQYIEKNYSLSPMTEDAERVYSRILSQSKEAVLCGYYGFLNSGDEWMKEALVARLYREGYARIHILSSRSLSWKVFGAIKRRADFYLGGGNLLQDATSRRSLWFYTALSRYALKKGCSLSLLSSGIGPLSQRGVEKALPILTGARRIEARTRKDAEAFYQAAPSASVFLTHDAALAHPFPEKSQNASLVLLVLQKPPSSIEYEFFSSLAHYLRENGTLQPFIVSLNPADNAFCKKAGQALSLPPSFVLLKGKEDVFSSLLSRAAFVFSNRLHAAVAALALGVPCVLFPQSAKATAFAEDVKEEAERLGVPAPCRLLPFSFEPFYDFSPKEEEILQVKNSLLNRFIPFSPTK